MSSAGAAKSILRASAVRNCRSKLASGVKPVPSPFRISTRKPLSARIFRCPSEMSSMQPFHTATASALMTSMLTLSRCGYSWLAEVTMRDDYSEDMCSILSTNSSIIRPESEDLELPFPMGRRITRHSSDEVK